MIAICGAGLPLACGDGACELPAGHDGQHQRGLDRWLQKPIILKSPDGYECRPFEPLTVSNITGIGDQDEEC